MKINKEEITRQYIIYANFRKIEEDLLLFFSDKENRYKDTQAIAENLSYSKKEITQAIEKLIEKNLIEK